VKAVKENADEKKRDEAQKDQAEKQKSGGPNGSKGPKGPKDTGTGAAIAGTVAAKQAKNTLNSSNTLPKTSVAARRNAAQKERRKARKTEQTENRKTGQTEKIEKKSKDMTPEESKKYFEKYKDDPVPVGDYKDKDMRNISGQRAKETGEKFEQHHVWPQAQSKNVSEVTGRVYKNKPAIPLPKDLHQSKGRKLIHKNNEASFPDHPRESLAQGIRDTRSGLREAGCDPQKVNDACLKALRKIKEDNPGGFEGKIPPK
jgi:hypothetical protein